MKMKQHISEQTNDIEQLSPVLIKLKQADQGFKVPDNYFDSLSPRIIDGIKKKENKSFSSAIIPQLRKPSVWRSVIAVMIFATMIISFMLVKKEPAVLTATDEWTEMNIAYDESYAEEVYLAESNILDEEMKNLDANYLASASVTANGEPTINEITEYLKEQEMYTDILNEY